jgi:hypothetical protein
MNEPRRDHGEQAALTSQGRFPRFAPAGQSSRGERMRSSAELWADQRIIGAFVSVDRRIWR